MSLTRICWSRITKSPMWSSRLAVPVQRHNKNQKKSRLGWRKGIGQAAEVSSYGVQLQATMQRNKPWLAARNGCCSSAGQVYTLAV